MTPDERAARAERCIRESVAEFRSGARVLRREAERIGTTAAAAMEACADTLACHARIAGIELNEPDRSDP